jgi:tetrachlorobenzoquinone reductase
MLVDGQTEASSPQVVRDNGLIDVIVSNVEAEAEGTTSYELRRPANKWLPTAEPGAHVDVHLPNGLIRQYSLLAAEYMPQSYRIAVKRDEMSRGGSRYIHDELHPGTRLTISAPRNHFPLEEDARHTIFIAGGIGITPIWCMLQRLHALKRSWVLHYSCRTASQAAFFRQLKKYPQARFHFDDEQGGQFLDLASIVRAAPEDTHLYCCGPLPMMSAFEQETAAWPRDQIHVEYFSPKKLDASERAFEVELSRSGRVVTVASDSTILGALQKAGLNLAYSCEQGICGTCETRVISGKPDHRDSVLTEAEKALGDRMMICCSRSLTDRLVLDL